MSDAEAPAPDQGEADPPAIPAWLVVFDQEVRDFIADNRLREKRAASSVSLQIGIA